MKRIILVSPGIYDRGYRFYEMDTPKHIAELLKHPMTNPKFYFHTTRLLINNIPNKSLRDCIRDFINEGDLLFSYSSHIQKIIEEVKHEET